MLSGTPRKDPHIQGSVVVFLLDPDGDATVPARGWRGRRMCIGLTDVPLEEIVASASAEACATLDVHAFVERDGETWIVLRSGSRYSQTNE